MSHRDSPASLDNERHVGLVSTNQSGNPSLEAPLSADGPRKLFSCIKPSQIFHATILYASATSVNDSNRTMSNPFGLWLKRQLDRRDMTRPEFARAIHKSPARLSEWINGKRIPDPKSCDLIADALGVDLDLVLWQAGHRPPTKEIDPEDPKIAIYGLVDRVHWTPGNVKLVTRVLRTLLEEEESQ